MAENLSYNFLDPMTEQCLSLMVYHDLTMVVSVGVMCIVSWFLGVFWFKKWFVGNLSNYQFRKSNFLEIFWTISPMFILIMLGYKSLINLYSMEVGDNVENQVKVTGHQWYWSYEYVAKSHPSMSLGEAKVVSSAETNTLFPLGLVLLNLCFTNECSDSYKNYPSSSLIPKLFEGWCPELGEFSSSNNSTTSNSSGESFLTGLNSPAISVMQQWVSIWTISKSLMHSCMSHLVSTNSELGKQVLGNRDNTAIFFGADAKVFEVGHKLESGVGEGAGSYDLSLDNYRNFNFFDHLLSDGNLNFSYDFNISADSLLGDLPRDTGTTDWLYLPVGMATEVTVTSADVLHSWGVPVFGVKVDAVPGRLNHVSVKPFTVGVAHGNCYELCGYGHSVMPINVLVVSKDSYLSTLNNMVKEEIYG